MLQFTLVVEKTIEGFDASIPSIRECETWAKDEDNAITSLLERLAFFLNREVGFKYDLDFMRREDGLRYYKLIIRS
jgi:predicted RNase H-like HicB family nuclease